MNIGIIGLPQAGKKTLFELLVGHGSAGTRDGRAVMRGVAEVQDPRFEKLVRIYQPKKQSRARVNVALLPTIEERSVSEGDIFRDLAEVDAFCHVVRAFQDDAVYHMSGSIDAIRDADYVNSEFILHDLVFIEKRLERITKDIQKAKDERLVKERAVLESLKAPLENETPLRMVDIPDTDETVIRSYPLLSRRAMIIVVNVGDEDATDFTDKVSARYEPLGIKTIRVASRIEAEIAALETEEERRDFMSELGIEDTALHALTEKCIDALGLISFFTAGPTEVHQWFVRRGASAVEAAGKIHTDLARGFIRAEVIKISDLIQLGSEDKVKSAGRLAVKGRDYIVEDGDILFVRFSV